MSKRGRAGRRRKDQLRRSSGRSSSARRDREFQAVPSEAGPSDSWPYAVRAGVALLAEACRIEGVAPVDPPDELDPETEMVQTEVCAAVAELLRQRGEPEDMAVTRAVTLARFERRRVWQRGGTVYDFRQALADRLQEVRQM